MVARNSKSECRFVFILYSRKVSCRKVSLSRTRCAGRGLELVPLRFPLVPLNWIFRWYQEKPLGSLTRHNWISHKDKWRTIMRVNGFIVMIMVSGLCQHQSQVMLWKTLTDRLLRLSINDIQTLAEKEGGSPKSLSIYSWASINVILA